nr:PREDICTED: UPF0728 protein C10orf53 homolog [Struthio camelus australis]
MQLGHAFEPRLSQWGKASLYTSRNRSGIGMKKTKHVVFLCCWNCIISQFFRFPSSDQFTTALYNVLQESQKASVSRIGTAVLEADGHEPTLEEIPDWSTAELIGSGETVLRCNINDLDFEVMAIWIHFVKKPEKQC